MTAEKRLLSEKLVLRHVDSAMELLPLSALAPTLQVLSQLWVRPRAQLCHLYALLPHQYLMAMEALLPKEEAHLQKDTEEVLRQKGVVDNLFLLRATHLLLRVLAQHQLH